MQKDNSEEKRISVPLHINLLKAKGPTRTSYDLDKIQYLQGGYFWHLV